MSLVILIDIGSTYTKLVVVDKVSREIVGRVTTPTTVGDISLGLKRGLDELKEAFSSDLIDACPKLACSSAAGGLRMVASGLVPDLTAEAAKRAALGGGARVLKTYSFQLTAEDLAEVSEIRPDILLLSGGTDGGNEDVILANARKLATLSLGIPVVIAGNRQAAAEVSDILTAANYEPHICANVMPQIGVLQVEPARRCIRHIFMEKIVYAKGFTRASTLIDGIFMPTPAAVLQAGQLLSEELGDLLIVDVGGATTDIHSLADGHPTDAQVMLRGLPEAFAKRTVEGDLGVRVSARSLANTVGIEALCRQSQVPRPEVEKSLETLCRNPETLGEGPIRQVDHALGFFATSLGVSRHVGAITPTFTPAGQVWIQEGKDLRKLDRVICTGGVYVHSPDPMKMAVGVSADPAEPLVLKPKSPRIFLDSQYLLAAMGLLSQNEPELALELLNRNLTLIS